eukprot:731055-Hanusia_phi.AAC.1
MSSAGTPEIHSQLFHVRQLLVQAPPAPPAPAPARRTRPAPAPAPSPAPARPPLPPAPAPPTPPHRMTTLWAPRGVTQR